MEVDTVKTRRRITDALSKTATPEELERIAGILGTKVEYLSDRPYFGSDQVRRMCQLRVGLKYTHFHSGNPKPFTLLEEPFLIDLRHNSRWIKIRYEETKRIADISLMDVSIFPYDYSPSRWNDVSYIAFTNDSRHLKDLACYCCSHEHHCSCPDGHTHSHHHCC